MLSSGARLRHRSAPVVSFCRRRGDGQLSDCTGHLATQDKQAARLKRAAASTQPRRERPHRRTIFAQCQAVNSNVVIHLELERMRAKPQRVVFLLLHLDPVGDEVGVEDVAAQQEGVIGLQRRDRAA